MTDLRQKHFRFRTDAGTADALPTWGAAEDEDYYPGTSDFRLRIGLENASTTVAATPWELYVSRNGDAFTAVTTTLAKGVQSVNAGSSADDTSILIPRLYPFTRDWVLQDAAIDIDFADGHIYPGTAFSDYLSCSRSSTGYAKTADGRLTSFATNTMRITDLGLLVENARTNLCLQSEDVATTWSAQQVTVTTNQAVAPDGNTTMDKLDDGVASNRHIIEQSFTISANTTYTVSAFVKDVDRRYVSLVWSSGIPGNVAVVADLQLGVITKSGVVDSAAGTTFNSASIDAYGNGIYRITVSGIVDNSSTTGYFNIGLSNTGTPTVYFNASPSYAGSNKSIYVWGMQIEAASFASSYIPTTAASATRAADNVTCLGSLDALLITLPFSTIIDLNALAAPDASWTIFGDNTATRNFLFSSSRDARVASNISASSIEKDFEPNAAYTTRAKVGIAMSAGARSITGGGASVLTSATAGAGSTGVIALGSQGGANVWYGYIKRATFWNFKLADATLETLTAP